MDITEGRVVPPAGIVAFGHVGAKLQIRPLEPVDGGPAGKLQHPVGQIIAGRVDEDDLGIVLGDGDGFIGGIEGQVHAHVRGGVCVIEGLREDVLLDVRVGERGGDGNRIPARLEAFLLRIIGKADPELVIPFLHPFDDVAGVAVDVVGWAAEEQGVLDRG